MKWIRFTSLAFLISIVGLAPLRAETLAFPRDSPAFTLVVPDTGWTGSISSDVPSVLSVSQELGQPGTLSIRSVPEERRVTDDAAAKKTLVSLAEEEAKSVGGTDIKWSEPSEVSVAGHKAYSIKLTYTYRSIPVTGENLIFTPDGKRYFMASSAGDVAAIVASIKPIK